MSLEINHIGQQMLLCVQYLAVNGRGKTLQMPLDQYTQSQNLKLKVLLVGADHLIQALLMARVVVVQFLLTLAIIFDSWNQADTLAVQTMYLQMDTQNGLGLSLQLIQTISYGVKAIIQRVKVFLIKTVIL